tara:strand:+ start:31631 stop:32494 length:864 start_codon:yes stop_codon:yes gene_type:complete
MSFIYTLKKGDKGQEVKRLQSRLKIAADGDFGPKTEQSVKDCQKQNSLVVDGLAGPQTLGALGIAVYPGIDVSAWNGKIDWKKVAAAGVKYVWVKATEGQTHTNRAHAEKFAGARDNNIIVGGYHFGRPDYNNHDDPMVDAEREAHHFLKTMKKVGLHSGDMLPTLDVEKGMKTDDQYNVEWSLRWLEVVENEIGCGNRPVIYTAKWAWDLFLAKANKKDLTQLVEYPIWWANYIRKDRLVGPEKKLRGWKNWDVWQYSGHGACPGIKGRCDLNWMAGDTLDKLRIS